MVTPAHSTTASACGAGHRRNAFTPTVSAVDAFGNTITATRVPSHSGSNDSMATLPGNYTFVPADNGSHQFPNGMTLRTPATYAQRPGRQYSSLTGTQTVFVNPGGAFQDQVLYRNPSTVTAGKTFTITVTITDAFANTVTGYQALVFFKTPYSNGQPLTPMALKYVDGRCPSGQCGAQGGETIAVGRS